MLIMDGWYNGVLCGVISGLCSVGIVLTYAIAHGMMEKVDEIVSCESTDKQLGFTVSLHFLLAFLCFVPYVQFFVLFYNLLIIIIYIIYVITKFSKDKFLFNINEDKKYKKVIEELKKYVN